MLNLVVLMIYLFLHCNCISQMNGELADVYESILICQVGVNYKHLHQGALHEVDHRQRSRGCKLTVLHVSHVHLLSKRI